MNYVASSMNSIKSCVSKTGFIDRLKLSNTGFGGGILGLINSNINGYFNAVGNLLTSISSESKAAVSMAQAWVDQDDALKKGVAGIITDGLLSTNEETPKTPEAPVIHDNQNNQKKYTIKGSTK